MLNTRCVLTALLSGYALAAQASALTAPYTETFDSAAANWSSGSTFTALTYQPSGGPDGSAYGTRSVSFATNPVGDIPLLFRGQSNFGSSGGNFWGDWIAGGVTSFSFSVRHNAPVPVTFFARFTPGAVGAVALVSPPLAPNTWATFTVPIDPSTPFVYEGTTFGTVFNNINRVQVGVMVDSAIAGQAGPYTFDIDNVSIVPAPGVAGLAGLAGLVALRRRR
ncbi:MAG: hypothetical protein U0637_05670 [Phycisphaerales bacterium]